MHVFDACPKCSCTRLPSEQAFPASCPQCGVTLSRYDASLEGSTSLFGRAKDIVLYVPSEVDVTHFWIRISGLCFIALWSIPIARADVTTGSICSGFVHMPYLMMHEAGHIVFAIFGTFMGVLGGSLMQVLLPLVGALSMLLRKRATIAAAVCVWCSGVGFVDVAPYIYDAQSPKLMLTSGATGRDSFHDWRFLLDAFDWVRFSKPFGMLAYWIGIAIMLLALSWGAYIMHLQAKNRAGDLYRER
jgi:hypothetical protein